MDITHQLLIVCPLVFFAGLVDSIAGGGGIISLPAYYAAGLTPHMALGTNKFASTFGTTLSTIRFIKNKKTDIKAAAFSAATALVGSALGAKFALFLSATVLKYILLAALPALAVFILKRNTFEKNSKVKDLPRSKVYLLCAVTGLVIGAYDGFFGPGTGTFLILIFNTVIGFDLLTSAGNAKIVNLSSNVAAFVTFLLNGSVLVYLAIPAAICSIAGNYVGSGIALKNGAKAIRPVFVFVLFLLIVKVGWDIFV